MRLATAVVVVGLVVALGAGLGASPAAGAPERRSAEGELHHQLERAGPAERIAASVGFGNLVGLGLPAIILVGGAMRATGITPPAVVARYVDPASPLYSWPFVVLALIALGLFFLSGNEKLTKGPKLLAQIAAIPPAAFLAIAVPIVVELSQPGTTAALLVDAGGGVVEGAHGTGPGVTVVGVLLALAMGMVALLSAMLILLTRLLVSFVVWLSPFPFIDALVNLAFHAWAGVLVVLTFVAPPAALFFMVVQTLVAVFLIRRLFRFGRVALVVGGGALRWHLLRGGVRSDADLAPWGAGHLDTEAAGERARLAGFLVEGRFAPKDAPAVVGLTERNVIVAARTWFKIREHRIPALELHEATARYGLLYDEIVLVHRQGAGVSRREVPIVVGLPKSQRLALAAFTDELRARGYDVLEEHQGKAGRPGGLGALPAPA